MAWLKNFKTKAAIPASQLKWNTSSTNTKSVADMINAKLDTSDLLDKVYPVGAIYMSVNSANPKTLFGGTWVQLKDRFLLGAGSTYTAGKTGGAATHTLTTAQIPSHTHTIGIQRSNAEQAGYSLWLGDGGFKDRAIVNGDASPIRTNATGGGEPHNNMPPYLVVYMWRRTA
jgi:hypothetical protein